MNFNKYTAEVANWANAIEIVADLPESGNRPESLIVHPGAKFLIAVISTPDGRQAPWIDAQVKLQEQNTPVNFYGAINSDITYIDARNSLIIWNNPPPRVWHLHTSSHGKMPFAMNAVSHHPAPDTIPQEPKRRGFRCTACKVTVKALAYAIVSVSVLPVIPHAAIVAVAGYLGVTTVLAGAFINSVFGESSKTIGEKLCEEVGLC